MPKPLGETVSVPDCDACLEDEKSVPTTSMEHWSVVCVLIQDSETPILEDT